MEVIPMSLGHVRRALCGVLVALTAFGLVACGRATEGVGSVSTIEPTHGVVVEVGAASYATNDTIAVTVRNNLGSGIIATDHQSSCTIVQVQIESNGSWQNQGGCSLGMPTRQIPLAAGSVTGVPVAPGAGQISAKPWPTGTYRVAFTYVVGTSVTSGASETVYSATFTVS
jgi:hypothetical protein